MMDIGKIEFSPLPQTSTNGLETFGARVLFPALNGTGNLVMKADHERIVAELEQQLEAARKDAERLDWLLRNVSGYEFRRMGFDIAANYETEGRTQIDAAISASKREVCDG